MSAVSLSRGLGMGAGLGSAAILLADSLVIAGMIAIAAATLHPWLAVSALCMVASALVCALAPDFAFLAFSLGTTAAFLHGCSRVFRIATKAPGGGSMEA